MDAVGREIGQMVEEVDIFPSLIDLTGLAIPSELQGTSWVPLLADESSPGKPAVFWQYPHSSSAHHHQTMGYTIRTKEWRYEHDAACCMLCDVRCTVYDAALRLSCSKAPPSKTHPPAFVRRLLQLTQVLPLS